MINVVLTYHHVPSPKHAHWILLHMASLLNATVYDVEKQGDTYEFAMQAKDDSITHAQIFEHLLNLQGQPLPDVFSIVDAPTAESDDDES